MKRRRCRVEPLETRKLMAADIHLNNGVLEVAGTSYNDVIELRFDSSDRLEVEIDAYTARGGRVDGDFSRVDLEDVRAIAIRGYSGNDQIRIRHEDPSDQTALNLRSHFDWLVIQGDSGADTIENMTSAKMTAYGGLHSDTIRGGSSDDLIFGGDDHDWLYGGGGNDIIRGEGGEDHIFGQQGHDQIFGGDQNDWLYGGDGNDAIMGEQGSDRIYGQNDHDRLYGHNANLSESNAAIDSDYIYGGYGQDTIRGGGGMDFLMGANGRFGYTKDTHSNFIYGDDGDDMMDGGSRADYMYGLNGNDVMVGHDGADYMSGGNHDDTLYGMAGNDRLYGNNGWDNLLGGADDDHLDGGFDGIRDRLSGESGNDTFVSYGYSSSGRWFTTEQEIELDFTRNDLRARNYGRHVSVLSFNTF